MKRPDIKKDDYTKIDVFLNEKQEKRYVELSEKYGNNNYSGLIKTFLERSQIKSYETESFKSMFEMFKKGLVHNETEYFSHKVVHLRDRPDLIEKIKAIEQATGQKAFELLKFITMYIMAKEEIFEKFNKAKEENKKTKPIKVNFTKDEIKEINQWIKKNPKYNLSSLIRYVANLIKKVECSHIEKMPEMDGFSSVGLKYKVSERVMIMINSSEAELIKSLEEEYKMKATKILRTGTMGYVRRKNPTIPPKSSPSQW